MQDFNNLSDEEKLSQLMDGEWQNLHPAESVASICNNQAMRDKWARYHIIRDSINSEPVLSDQSLVSRICAAIDDEPAYSNVHSLGGSSAASGSVVNSDFVDDAADQLNDQSVSAQVSTTNTETTLAANSASPSWLNTGLVGFALAASVALVTVVGLNVFEQQNDAASVSTVASATTVAPVSTVVAQNTDATVMQSVVSVDASKDAQSAHLPEVELVANTGSTASTGAFWVSPDSSQRVVNEERLNMMLSQHIENSPTSLREGLLPYSRLVGYEEVNKQP